MSDEPAEMDLGARLRRWTQARVGLGRAGQSLPTSAVLEFELAHARARDAVNADMRIEQLMAELPAQNMIAVNSRADARETYLKRPDLGRLLDPDSEGKLAKGDHEAAIVIGDGLSATAIHRHAAPLVRALHDRLRDWRIAPLVAARHARVALGDEIGAALGAHLVVVLIGERPGLSAPDSLGAYLTWHPRRGRLDSERNCVSNIRPPHGLGYAEATDRIVWLMTQARLRQVTGIELKDEATVPTALPRP